ncbi:MAG: zincin-like metallopeptidase domain-containing protein [Burkholderia sp.]
MTTLRHEVIGHFGLNTFTGAEKKALLDGVSASRQEPSMRGMWARIDANYADKPESIKAEEVFALFCEGIEPGQHINSDQVHERGEQAFRETCIDRTRPMRIDDLDNITLMVAQGLHDRTRTQQNFPELNQQFRKDGDMESKKPFHETVAEKLIEQLKEGTAPWQKPWEPGQPGAFIPTNPTTGKRYRGINAIQLMSQGHSDQRWMTYKQAAAVGAQVRKGEKGTPIQYWKFSEEQTKTDADGKPVLDAQGEPVKQSVKLERPRVFFATVFNAEQIDGLPPIQARKEQEWNAVDRAEQILQASGAVIRHGEQNRAFYRPATDSIHLPDKGQFPTADNYYATALHELGHWTGHESRLDRDLVHPFGSEGYAKEELRAEIASMILGDELGIGHDPGQHAAYVGSWIKALQDDPLEIFRAAADAEKIQDYVLGLEQKQVQEQTADQRPSHQEQEAKMQTAHALRDQLLAALSPDAVQGIERAAEARRQHAAGEIDGQAFAEAAQRHLGMKLPADWNGELRIVGIATQDGKLVDADQAGVAPEEFQVFARKGDVQPSDDAFAAVAATMSGSEAEMLADRLRLVDALAEANEHDQAAKLARIHEERVRSDPNSTAEDISAAKEARQSAEATAMLNDADLQRRIAEYEREQQAATPAAAQQPNEAKQGPEKTFINVPFKQKDEAKALGAKWDRQEQSWYVPAGVDPAPFAKWAQGAATAAADAQQQPQATQAQGERQKPAQERQYLAVPYGERVAAKAAGAEWDKTAKSWYAGPKADMAKLERWKPENVQGQQGPAMTPQEEFAEALRSVGCVVSGEHPIMDGQKHRISVEGEKHSEKAGSGFYVGHLDGHPAGYIKNNKTGIDMKWKSKGYALDPEQKAALQAEAAAKLQARDAEQARLQEATAQRVGRQMADLVPVAQPTPYMQAKGIEPQPGVLTDKEGQKTYIPATDVDGKQWTMQYIQEDGTKRFAKDSRKEGCFHVVGGMDALAQAPALVIGEGYATASSLSQSLGFATVAAFDSGNLPAVAKALHEKFPDKPVIIAGDNDQHLEATQGVNPGKAKAQEAAKATGDKVLLPIFAPGEQAANPKGFTDFNDLATKSALGKEGIDRQVRSVVGSVIEKHQARIEQQQERVQEQRPRRAAKIG